jgi:hypothetical protein
MSSEVQPQDQDSGLVERKWQRKNRRGGMLTERTLEGKDVKVAWLDRQGHLQRAAGKVIRNADGELVVESWADSVRQETPVGRDANVDVKAKRR